jgi:hypothetical protein
MKKGTKIGLLVGIILIALGLTVMQLARHRGEDFETGLTSITSIGSMVGVNYDQKGFTVCRSGEESFSPREVEFLKIDWLTGSVNVERYDGRELVVREKASVELAEDECLRYQLSDGKLTILPCANRVSTLPQKQLTILVPRGMSFEKLEIDVSAAEALVRGIETNGRLALGSGSGSLTVEDCSCGALRLASASGSQVVRRTAVVGKVSAGMASGSFKAEKLECGEMDVDSASGGQQIHGLSCRELTLSATSGSVTADGLRCGSVKAGNASGSVELSFDDAPESVKVGTASGSVKLSFPRNTGIDLDFDTASGKLRGKVVDGSLPVEVDTASGNLTIDYHN